MMTTPSPESTTARHHEVALRRLMDEATEGRRKLEAPGGLAVRATNFGNTELLIIPGIFAGRDVISESFPLEWEIDGGVGDGFAGQSLADNAGAKLVGDHLLIVRREREYHALGAGRSGGEDQKADYYGGNRFQLSSPFILIRRAQSYTG